MGWNHYCQVLEVIPNKRLAYALQSEIESNVARFAAEHRGRLDPSEVETGARLPLVHSGFVTPKNIPR